MLEITEVEDTTKVDATWVGVVAGAAAAEGAAVVAEVLGAVVTCAGVADPVVFGAVQAGAGAELEAFSGVARTIGWQ